MSTAFLLDSHVLLWYFMEDARLSADIAVRLETEVDTFAVSTASIWEIEIKHALGKLVPPGDPLETARAKGFHILDITPEHAIAAARLPRHHGDPFDRMLIAQAQIFGMVVVTSDSAFLRYDVPVLFARP